jgi:hypothetical protein
MYMCRLHLVDGTDAGTATWARARVWSRSRPGATQGFREQAIGKERRVIVAASTVAIVAIAAVAIVALIAFMYIVPRGGRKRRPKP